MPTQYSQEAWEALLFVFTLVKLEQNKQTTKNLNGEQTDLGHEGNEKEKKLL